MSFCSHLPGVICDNCRANNPHGGTGVDPNWWKYAPVTPSAPLGWECPVCHHGNSPMNTQGCANCRRLATPPKPEREGTE